MARATHTRRPTPHHPLVARHRTPTLDSTAPTLRTMRQTHRLRRHLLPTRYTQAQPALPRSRPQGRPMGSQANGMDRPTDQRHHQHPARMPSMQQPVRRTARPESPSTRPEQHHTQTSRVHTMVRHTMRTITAWLAFYRCKHATHPTPTHHLTRIGCWIYGSTPVRH